MTRRRRARRPLEDQYRLLLRAYPPSFRRRHATDLLTVLLAAAADGQRRPGLRDALDLVGSGLRMRLLALRTTPARLERELLPTPSSAPLPDSYGQALQTIWPSGFRPTVEDGRWPGVPRWVRVVSSLIVAAACVAGGVSMYRHFFDLEPLQTTRATQTASMPVDSTIWVSPGLVVPAGQAEHGLDLTAIRPVLRSNTAGATITVESCPGAFTDVLVSGASASWNAPGLCTTLHRNRDYRVPAGYLDQPVPIVLAIHATRPGIVRIAGVDVDVHRGLQRGSLHLGISWTVTSHHR